MTDEPDPPLPAWHHAQDGHLLHRSGLSFRVGADQIIAEPDRHTLEQWQLSELQGGLSLIDLHARLVALIHEGNEFLRHEVEK